MLRCDPRSAEVMAGRLCVTYLCFSDFKTAVSRRTEDQKVDLTTAFKERGPISIPAALGLRKDLHSIPYKFFGGQGKFKMPDIDYSKYLNIKTQDRRPSPDFKSKFALLEYVIEYRSWHTRWLQWSSEPSSHHFWGLVQPESLAFEFRPWGSNKRFGPSGCKGCPVPDSNDLEPKDLPSMGLVHWAAETGYLVIFDMVEPPIPIHEYLHHERHHDETLFVACRHGQDAVVEFLLACRTFDLSNLMAIVNACASGRAPILARLKEAQDKYLELTHRQSSPSAFDLRDFDPAVLYQAAKNGHEEVVESLLAWGCEADIGDTVTGLTSLQEAARNGYLKIVKALCKTPLRRHIDAPHKTTGMKALHYAAANGHGEVASLLVTYGFGCDDQNSLGETALIKASQNRHFALVKVLLQAGAEPLVRGGELCGLEDLYARHPFNLTQQGEPQPLAIHHAAANGHDMVLIVLPYSGLTCGRHGTNALHLAAWHGHSKAAQALLLRGANSESKDFSGMTALHYASCNGQNLVAKLLLENGSSVDSTEADGKTALHLAAENADIETIKLLVAHGAALTTKTLGPKGTPALHLAVLCANKDTVRTLVECGAPLEQQDIIGRTALDVALGHGKLAIVVALIKLGAKYISYLVSLRAISVDDSDMARIIVNELSTTALAEEQKKAAVVIKRLLEEAQRQEGDWNGNAIRVLAGWRAEWEAGSFDC